MGVELIGRKYKHLAKRVGSLDCYTTSKNPGALIRYSYGQLTRITEYLPVDTENYRKTLLWQEQGVSKEDALALAEILEHGLESGGVEEHLEKTQERYHPNAPHDITREDIAELILFLKNSGGYDCY
jgi:hypothetical protein